MRDRPHLWASSEITPIIVGQRIPEGVAIDIVDRIHCLLLVGIGMNRELYGVVLLQIILKCIKDKNKTKLCAIGKPF